MRKYLAILKDSFYETIDFKLFYVLVGLSLFLGLVCLSFPFPRLAPHEVFTKNLDEHAGGMSMGAFGANPPRQRGEQSQGNPAAEVTDFTVLDEQPGSGRYRFVLMPRDRDAFGQGIATATQQRRLLKQLLRMEMNWQGLFAQMSGAKPPEGNPAWTRAIKDYLASVDGVSDVAVLTHDADGKRGPARIQAEAHVDWSKIPYTHQLGILFGLYKVDVADIGQVVGAFQTVLVEYVAGWAGLIVAIIVTAGFIPNMLQKGTIDLLLVKPIHRPALLIYKYLGGLLFVLFNGLVLVLVTWLALSYNSGRWSGWYLVSIVALVSYFAILYSLSVLMGVLTRSPLVAILVTIGVWLILWIVNQLHVFAHLADTIGQGMELPATLVSTIDWVHFLLPKPGTLSQLNQMLIAKGAGSQNTLIQQQAVMSKMEISWGETVWTSLAFIVIMLGLASWRFSRKDY